MITHVVKKHDMAFNEVEVLTEIPRGVIFRPADPRMEQLFYGTYGNIYIATKQTFKKLFRKVGGLEIIDAGRRGKR